MSEELERAAEALYLEGCRRAIAVGMMKDPPHPFAEIAESSRRDYRLSAAAVIRSIREPTDAMLGEHNKALVHRVWTAVIDKLLEE